MKYGHLDFWMSCKMLTLKAALFSSSKHVIFYAGYIYMPEKVVTTFFIASKAFNNNKKSGGNGDGLRLLYNYTMTAKEIFSL